jgi:hypothetical protein
VRVVKPRWTPPHSAPQNEQELGDAVVGVTWPPEMATSPVTALVRPATSLLNPRALSRTRKPACEPAPGCQAPVSGPVGRLRAELGGTFHTLATLLDATMRGMVLTALSTPELAERRVRARPFGAAGLDEWSLAAMGLASIAAAFLEPDPAIVWDEPRVASVREALQSLSLPAGSSRGQ